MPGVGILYAVPEWHVSGVTSSESRLTNEKCFRCAIIPLFRPHSSADARVCTLRFARARLFIVLAILVTGFVVSLQTAHAFVGRAYGLSQAVGSNQYWFQVGAWAQSQYGYANHFGIPVTGASVEIRVLSNQELRHRDSDAAYWIGLNLPNDAFIQVGYLADRNVNGGESSWFWEYFLPGTATEGTGGFLGDIGSVVRPNGTWIKFMITSQESTWSAYVDQKQVGSADLGLSNSRIGPYASAEIAQVREADNPLGPVEFRNLAYRDTDLTWHLADAAVALCCYSSGSARLGGVAYPYGVAGVPGENNHWLAGSGVPLKSEGEYLWPWFKVTVNSPYGSGSGSGWYVYGDTVTPAAMSAFNISKVERYHLAGWNVSGTLSESSEYEVTKNLNLTAVYSRQFLVNVVSPFGKSSGSGWYDAGSQASVSVIPSSAKAPGLLGQLGVKAVFSRWTGDYAGSETRPTINVDSPKTIQAEWSYDYSPAILLIGLLSVGTLSGLAITYRQIGPHLRLRGKGRVRHLARKLRGRRSSFLRRRHRRLRRV